MKIKKLKLIKQITYIVLIVMICNFIMPNYIYASDDNDIDLLEPISQLLCWIPDMVIDFLQMLFVNPNSIELPSGEFSIKYSPATIFAGEVPAFDINFIEPRESKIENTISTENYSLIDALDLNGAEPVKGENYIYSPGLFTTKNGCIEKMKGNAAYEYDEDRQIDISILQGKLESQEYDHSTGIFNNTSSATEIELLEGWYNSDKSKVYVIVHYINMTTNTSFIGGEYVTTIQTVKSVSLYELDTIEDLESATEITGAGVGIVTGQKEYVSTAAILQNSVATWYKALRRIALVGLLSVLIYIGIRILLTSTSANDKAKYKSMLKDWLIALCILFTMHYIMSITIVVVDNVNSIVKSSVIGEDGEDVLVTTIRNEIVDGDDWGEVLVHIVLYYVIGIYTIIFSIQYIRRTIYLAFLTMISPLITLTYPLDKIKDSKSQAFDMWIKDYMFFTLLQVIHLLIYYILVGMSIDLVEEGNWVYSIIAIGFLIPAEKIVKRMFGFEKSKSMGALAAGATGALVTDVINKIKVGNATKGKSKDNSEKTATGNTKNNIRTALNNPISGMQGGGGFASVPESSGTTGTNTVVPGAKPSIQPIKGVTSLVGRYHRNIGGAVLGSMLGASGAMIGFASGVAQGDLGKAFKGAAAGGTAGYGLGKAGYNFASNTASGIKNTAKDVIDTFNEGSKVDNTQ